ncbi:hypothetical protein SAMN05444161_1824 [Rhizobiales bacterium GAS191]|nr:hypothetical protein SAMN05519103_00943 [Rhizobiales bacterium GAS113]SEC78098.1 hypothetical protein SAMN05444161_1824 [Rhizobiales bacterium GAS191]
MCNSDIAKALVGQRGANEPVVAIEGRHKDLDLKDLGASDYGSFSSITWLICGKEFYAVRTASRLLGDEVVARARAETSAA